MRKRTNLKASLVILILLLGTAGASFAAPASFLGLGDLPGGIFHSWPYGVSSDGSVVVGYSRSASGNEAFRWTSDPCMVGLGDLAGGIFESEASDVSADGSVVVGDSSSALGNEAFRWTQAGGMVGLGDLTGGGFWSVALGVSSDGSVVVGWGSSSSGGEAFRWTSGGGMVGLGDLAGGSFDSSAREASADGSVVVGASESASGYEAFRWTSGGGMVGLGDLAGGDFFSTAWGVSADGSVVVGWSSSASGTEAFRWTQAGGMVGLGNLTGGGFYGQAWGVSADGSVVVGQSFSASGQEAIIWDAGHGMRSLRDLLVNENVDMTGWKLLCALGISADGLTIVGYGLNPSSDTEAWVAMFPHLDEDGDGVADIFDNCPKNVNLGQEDNDSDGVGNICDNCPNDVNPWQSDVDLDGAGDICDDCPAVFNDECDPCGSGAEEIGRDTGGTIVTPDGNMIIDIDPCDLFEDTTISVTQIIPQDANVDLMFGPTRGRGAALAAYDLEPDELDFNSPVTITVRVTGLTERQCGRAGLFLWDVNHFVPIGDSNDCNCVEDPCEVYTRTCTVELEHFSTIAMIREVKILYVDANAVGAEDGSSWTDAYKYLQDALGDSVPDDQIWAAAGTYYPDANTSDPNSTGDRTATFGLINGVAIYGGFAGNED
ncbi:MAG: hypothetical protein ACYS91_19715, partial [Planctomycetota bacterium]